MIASPNKADMSVTPEVQDVASSASFVGLAVTNASSPARSRFVYVTPPTTPVSPTLAPGHMMVTPLAPR